MFEHSFWQYSGLFFWAIIFIYILIRIFFGKNWLHKIGLNVIAGAGLISSFKKLYSEYPNKIKKETLAELSAHIIWRITRIGIIGLLIAAFPIWLLMQQNRLIGLQNDLFKHQNNRVDEQTGLLKQQTNLLESQDDKFEAQNKLITEQNQKIDLQTRLFSEQNHLFSKQNEKVDTQNYRLNLQNNLIEADRRSSLVFLMSNVLDRVDVEIASQRQARESTQDTTKYSLSKPLVSRIVALSRAFRPYRMLEGDTLSDVLVSPERGQFFIALMKINLDSITQNTIARDGDFSYAQVGRIDFSNAKLAGANLYKADFEGANFRGANLRSINLEGANLAGANLNGVDLSEMVKYNYRTGQSIMMRTNLSRANLSKVDFRNARLTEVNFSNSNLQCADFTDSDLSYSTLSDADLTMANFTRNKFFITNFSGANLTGATFNHVDFANVSGLAFIQMKELSNLYDYKNLDENLKAQLVKKSPSIFGRSEAFFDCIESEVEELR